MGRVGESAEGETVVDQFDHSLQRAHVPGSKLDISHSHVLCTRNYTFNSMSVTACGVH